MPEYSSISYRESFLNQVIVRVDFLQFAQIPFGESIEKEILQIFPRRGKDQIIRFNSLNVVFDQNNNGLPNANAVIFDELHAQPNRELFDVMTKGSGDARTQPLYFMITTAGTDRNSICFEQHQKAVDIIEGRKIDSTFYPVIYGASDEDDWTSEAIKI